MKRILFTVIMLLGSLSFAGGSEVPWPIDKEESVFLEDIAGVWASKSSGDALSFYYFYMQEKTASDMCPYIVGLDEVSAETGTLLRRGSSAYCLQHPRKLSFDMVNAQGQVSHVLTFVGIKLDETQKLSEGRQYIGLSVFDAKSPQDTLEQDMLQKVAGFCYVGKGDEAIDLARDFLANTPISNWR